MGARPHNIPKPCPTDQFNSHQLKNEIPNPYRYAQISHPLHCNRPCPRPILQARNTSIHADQSRLIFSGVQGLETDPLTLTLTSFFHADIENLRWEITGENRDHFSVSSAGRFELTPNQSATQQFTFNPQADTVGYLKAAARLVGDNDESYLSIDLYGLSAIGLEGSREPGLYLITDTVGLSIDLGWRSHNTHTRPELIGSEIALQRFKKANPGQITLTPIARYSPDFLLPFGYYRVKDGNAALTPVGTLALKTATSFQQNCLYPRLASGDTRFDPGAEPFGVFTSSPSHVAYSEDSVNEKLEPEHIARAARVYPAMDRSGDPIVNTYLICFEEATNGDYQDYVFLIDNVVAVE